MFVFVLTELGSIIPAFISSVTGSRLISGSGVTARCRRAFGALSDTVIKMERDGSRRENELRKCDLRAETQLCLLQDAWGGGCNEKVAS